MKRSFLILYLLTILSQNANASSCEDFHPEIVYKINKITRINRKSLVQRYIFSPASPFKDADSNVECAKIILQKAYREDDDAITSIRLYAIIMLYGLKVSSYIDLLNYMRDKYADKRVLKEELILAIELGLGISRSELENIKERSNIFSDLERVFSGDRNVINFIDELKYGRDITSLP